MINTNSTNKISPKYGFATLFFLLSSTLLIYPILDSLFFTRVLMRIFFTVIFLSAIYVISNRRWIFWLGVSLIIPTILFSWSSYIWANFTNQLLTDFFSLLFSILLIVVFAEKILHEKEKISKDLIFATLCTYLLIGLAWADAYALIETLIPHSFSSTAGIVTINYTKREIVDFIYYSFVTLTTLGYGDIVPLTLQAKFFSASEAITGQLFIATAIAKSIGLYIQKKKA